MFKSIKNTFSLLLNGDKIPNVLLGAAIGDSLGLPFETMKCNNKLLLDWDGKSFHSSEFHKTSEGQTSDDTDMSVMVAESLIYNKKFNPDDLSQRYIDWIYSGRAKGFGKTTKLSIDNLKNGIHWSKSGIEGSVGNGTAMRAAPFGVFYANKDFSDMYQAVKIDSAMTHKSVEAEAGALAIAIATYLTIRKEELSIPNYLSVHLPDSRVKNKIFKAYDMALDNNKEPNIALQALGTKADVRDTVPSAMYCFWRFKSFENAVVAAIRAGKDTDTLGSVVGALMGAKTRLSDIPSAWVKGVENSGILRELDTKLVGLK